MRFSRREKEQNSSEKKNLSLLIDRTLRKLVNNILKQIRANHISLVIFYQIARAKTVNFCARFLERTSSRSCSRSVSIICAEAWLRGKWLKVLCVYLGI